MKKVLKILTLIMLILTIWTISDTYAKFFTKATITAEYEVGKWQILLNEMDIYSEKGEAVTFTMSAQNAAEDSNTASGKLAPNSSLYADIMLNPTGTDVAVRYDIEVNLPEIENLDLQFEVTIPDSEKVLTKTADNIYTGIISLADIQENKQEQIRCTIKWNAEEEINIKDLALGNTFGSKLEIPIKVTCVQYLGELDPENMQAEENSEKQQEVTNALETEEKTEEVQKVENTEVQQNAEGTENT